MAKIQEAQKSSITNFQRLYALMAALAVTELFKKLYPIFDSGTLSYTHLLFLIAFLFTFVPFYHGSNRYLDASYIIGDQASKPKYILFDFSFLLIECLLLFATSMSILTWFRFCQLLTILLYWDCIWTGVTHLHHSNSKSEHFRWMGPDLCAAILISFVVWFDINSFTYLRATLILVIAIARTYFEYKFTWKFFFPGTDDQTANDAQTYHATVQDSPSQTPASV